MALSFLLAVLVDDHATAIKQVFTGIKRFPIRQDKQVRRIHLLRFRGRKRHRYRHAVQPESMKSQQYLVNVTQTERMRHQLFVVNQVKTNLTKGREGANLINITSGDLLCDSSYRRHQENLRLSGISAVKIGRLKNVLQYYGVFIHGFSHSFLKVLD